MGESDRRLEAELLAIAERARAFAKPDAAAQVADVCEAIAREDVR